MDYESIEIDKIHTTFHILEDETGYKLSDILEIHFLELPKLKKLSSLRDVDDPILEWLEFIDSDSKEGMAMLAEQNENIKVAYEILQRVSRSKEARAAYEARQAEIMDQMTREKSAEKKGVLLGIEQGIQQEKISLAKNALLMNLSIEQVVALTGLSKEKIKELI